MRFLLRLALLLKSLAISSGPGHTVGFHFTFDRLEEERKPAGCTNFSMQKENETQTQALQLCREHLHRHGSTHDHF